MSIMFLKRLFKSMNTGGEPMYLHQISLNYANETSNYGLSMFIFNNVETPYENMSDILEYLDNINIGNYKLVSGMLVYNNSVETLAYVYKSDIYLVGKVYKNSGIATEHNLSLTIDNVIALS